ncbi:Gfo/Idh/MocA family protein [Lutibacter holmesii]|uniref:Gfo/Idh/MocA family protein n=1 Tax=Lutibacter holmesii TaxID=1137985 RepID=A0ABW3WT71_9FLAO
MSTKKHTPTLIRWGIIGCGNVTEVKSGPPYYLVKGFNLVAVMRRDLEKAKNFAQRHQIQKYYSNADELIHDNEVDAIYIATPPDTHKYYALKVAEAKKPCCIEKPLTPNYNDSLTIYNTFKKLNIPLFVAYYRRSLPRFTRIKKWLTANKIGTVRHINWHLSKNASEQDISKKYNWRTDATIAPAGYFDDLASHGIDLFTYLLGNIKEAKGISLNQQKLYSAKDAITACWVHENGITGAGSWNFGCNTREDTVEIFGSKGKICFSVFDKNPIILKNEFENESLIIEHPKHVQFFHVENMRDHLFGKSIHPSLGKSALHTSWVMDKILGTI